MCNYCEETIRVLHTYLWIIHPDIIMHETEGRIVLPLVMETMRQTRKTAETETICLKVLKKEVQQRANDARAQTRRK